MLSRRGALVGGGAAVAGAAGLSQIRPWDIEPWEPTADTWPLERYDLANTAANRTASVPAAPEINWQVDAVEPVVSRYSDQGAPLLVGPETIHAGGDRVVAIDRNDGTKLWTDHRAGEYLALREDSLYAASENDRVPMRAYASTSATERWVAPLTGDLVQLLVADGRLVVGQSYSLAIHDASDGSRLWIDDERRGSPNEGVLSAIHEGSLFSVDRRDVVRYRSRSVLNRTLGLPPSREWNAADSVHFHHPRYPVAEESRIVVGTRLQTNETGNPPLLALDRRSGEVIWEKWIDEDTDALVAVRTPAVVDGLGITGIQFGEFEDRRHSFAGVSLSDGSLEWTRSTDSIVTDVVVGAETAVVATLGDDEVPGAVIAVDPTDGTEQWRRQVDAGVLSIALVDGVLFAMSGDGTVVSFR